MTHLTFHLITVHNSFVLISNLHFTMNLQAYDPISKNNNAHKEANNAKNKESLHFIG